MSRKRARRKKAEKRAPDTIEIEASTPELWRVLFARDLSLPAPEEEEAQHRVSFQLGLGRVHARHIGVELTASIHDVPWLVGQQIVVTYRMYFRIWGECAEDQLEANIRVLATLTGPATLFPFIRETIANVTGKSGQHIMLPLVRWDTMFPNVEMPSPEEPTPLEFLEPRTQLQTET